MGHKSSRLTYCGVRSEALDHRREVSRQIKSLIEVLFGFFFGLFCYFTGDNHTPYILTIRIHGATKWTFQIFRIVRHVVPMKSICC